ncbi:MAG: GatB/YqeY domain-containing protein [Bacteroidota bacterium]
MSLEQRITADLKTAMKAKDEAGKRGIRAIKQAILLAKTDGSGAAITEEKEIQMLQKLVKQRKESLAIYEAQDRAELAQVEREEIEVIERYLPQQMEAEALETYLKDLIEQMGATSMKDMGKIMGKANKDLAGRADGRTISTVVKRLLS